MNQIKKLPYPKIEPTGYTSWGRTEFVLVENFDLSIDLGWGQYDLLLIVGTKTDFGSVPWPLRLVVNPLDPQLLVGWILHDDLYCRHVTTRFFADAMARFVHQLYGASWWKRLAVYYAVRLFGWLAWRKVRAEKVAEQSPELLAKSKLWTPKILEGYHSLPDDQSMG